MAILRMIGRKQISLAGLEITLDATLERDDANGQLYVRVEGSAGADAISERISIGAEDGKDALATMSAAERTATLQAAVDNARQAIANKIANRALNQAAAAQVR
jgi:hypothetical protein